MQTLNCSCCMKGPALHKIPFRHLCLECLGDAYIRAKRLSKEALDFQKTYSVRAGTVLEFGQWILNGDTE
jgi:hypothetical protein